KFIKRTIAVDANQFEFGRGRQHILKAAEEGVCNSVHKHIEIDVDADITDDFVHTHTVS
ncbi:hypothetical protein LPJ59_006771, partial [Coemansia sp. RSA 2399]